MPQHAKHCSHAACFVHGESHQAKLVSCHVVLYRCLARSHHVTSCLAMPRLRLKFVTRLRSVTQSADTRGRERHSKLNSTVLSWHRATSTKHFRAPLLCQTSWCAVPSRQKEPSHCEQNYNCNSSHQIAFAASFRNTRTRRSAIAFKASASATAPASPTWLL